MSMGRRCMASRIVLSCSSYRTCPSISLGSAAMNTTFKALSLGGAIAVRVFPYSLKVYQSVFLVISPRSGLAAVLSSCPSDSPLVEEATEGLLSRSMPPESCSIQSLPVLMPIRAGRSLSLLVGYFALVDTHQEYLTHKPVH